MTTSNVRLERDFLGEVQVPADRLWGAQTQRAVHSFPIGDQAVPPALIRAIAVIKRAAARVHGHSGALDERTADAIDRAAAEVAAGELDDHFPLVVWQSGSGTQTHMNVNEVVARRASELLGDGAAVHPNDAVNRAQSTNDVMPTAMSIALVGLAEDALLPAVGELRAAIERKGTAWASVVKIGRTHLMDATPIALGQEASAWAAQLARVEAAVRDALVSVRELAIGGTAVGTGINTPPGWRDAMVAELCALTGRALAPAPNLFDAVANADGAVRYSGALRLAACALAKIANDVRLLASGPRCGIGELELPVNEPGSSIMPGKVNPTQAEAVCMVCARVIGNDAGIGFAGASGNLQLGTYRPFIAHAAIESTHLLADAMRSFAARCIDGLEPNERRIAQHLDESLMLVTALVPYIGYDLAAALAREAHHSGRRLRDVAIEQGALTADEFDAVVRPADLV